MRWSLYFAITNPNPPSSTPVNTTAVAVAANAAHDGENQRLHELEVRIAELERWKRETEFSFGCTSVGVNENYSGSFGIASEISDHRATEAFLLGGGMLSLAHFINLSMIICLVFRFLEEKEEHSSSAFFMTFLFLMELGFSPIGLALYFSTSLRFFMWYQFLHTVESPFCSHQGALESCTQPSKPW
jgi:hypothetical protein